MFENAWGIWCVASESLEHVSGAVTVQIIFPSMQGMLEREDTTLDDTHNEWHTEFVCWHILDRFLITFRHIDRQLSQARLVAQACTDSKQTHSHSEHCHSSPVWQRYRQRWKEMATSTRKREMQPEVLSSWPSFTVLWYVDCPYHSFGSCCCHQDIHRTTLRKHFIILLCVTSIKL